MQTESALFPQIGYAASGARTLASQNIANPLPPGAINPFPGYFLAATLEWQIDFWGRVQRLTESSRAQLYAAIESRRQVLLNLIASVATSYIVLRALDEQLVISKNTLAAYEEELDFFSKQFKYGQTSEMSVAQAQTQVELAASAIPGIEAQIAEQESSLAVLLGSIPKPIPRGKSISQLKAPNVPAELPSEILEARPDVRAAEEILISKNALIGAAKALYFPSISLTAYYGVASDALKNLFQGASKTWNYTGEAIGPILTWGGLEGGVIASEGDAMAALANYQLAIQQAFSEVESALATHEYFREQLKAQIRLVEAASNYVRLSQLQYKGGYSPYFVVLQAQQQLFPSELSLAKIRAQQLIALVNIYQSMGGGWVDLYDGGCL
jgi:multidrug efflux system outer membrane protein